MNNRNNLTAWYPAEIKPVRVGYYQRKWVSYVVPDFWDGEFWREKPNGYIYAHAKKNLHWRGLAADPSKTKKSKDRI